MTVDDLTLRVRKLFKECLDLVPLEGSEIHCLPVDPWNLYVGSDSAGRLLAVFPAATDRIELNSGHFSFASRQSITWRERPTDIVEFSVLYLLETSQDEIDRFSDVVVSLCQCIESGMDGVQLARVIQSWFGLLLSGNEPTYSEALGLWGELFMISIARNRSKALSAWQWRDADPLDFIYHGSALEVKCTSRASREHSTSLTQHIGATSMSTVVASVMTRDEIEGSSVFDLYSQLLIDFSNDSVHAAKLVSAYARRIGFSKRVTEWKFSLDKARSDLLYFSWDGLPKVEIQDGVSSANWSFILNDSLSQEVQDIDESISQIF